MENISIKNHTMIIYFYYWYWKNYLKYKQKMSGLVFCSYRELWGNDKIKDRNSINYLLKSLPESGKITMQL